MDRFIIYKYAYLVTLPLAVLAIIWFPLSYIYLAIFMVGSIMLIIERYQQVEFPDSSAASHYDMQSRFNWFNYIISGVLIVAALIIATTPLNYAITTLVIWTLIMVFFQVLLPRYLPQLHQELIVDYIESQLPTIDRNLIKAIVDAKIRQPEIISTEITKQWDLEDTQTNSIIAYYENYVQRNNEVFKFLPSFISKFEDISKHVPRKK